MLLEQLERVIEYHRSYFTLSLLPNLLEMCSFPHRDTNLNLRCCFPFLVVTGQTYDGFIELTANIAVALTRA